jgi:hypothetical protein
MIALQIWPRIEFQGTSDLYEYTHDIRRVTQSSKRCLRKIRQTFIIPFVKGSVVI